MASLTLNPEQLLDLPESPLAALVAASGAAAILETWAPLLPQLTLIGPDFIGSFLNRIEQEKCVEDLVTHGYLAADSSWSQSPRSHWLQARLLRATGKPAEAFRAFEQILKHGSSLPSQFLLDAASTAIESGEYPMAAHWLSLATRYSTDFHLIQKAVRLYRRLEKSGPLDDLPTLRIALLLDTAPQLIEPILKAKGYAAGIHLEIFSADYNGVDPLLFGDRTPLLDFSPDIAILQLNYPQLEDLHKGETPTEWVSRQAERARRRWSLLSLERTCRILQHTCDLPPSPSDGNLSTTAPHGLSHRIHLLNAALLKTVPENVSIVDTQRLQTSDPSQTWNDDRLWYMARQHPAPESIPVLADEYIALARAHLGYTKKIIVLDLDNTLWGGVIGEDGIEGIQIGTESPEAEAHRNFQIALKQLRDRGILLAVSSKNNEADARLPFEAHDGMYLQLEDFAAFQANWNSKDQQLRSIAERLNLGLDSFVFVDDNPVEREWIRNQLPEVTVIDLPSDPSQFTSALLKGRWFEALAISEEDRRRSEIYRQQAERKNAQQHSSSLDEYLAGLQMIARSGPFDAAHINRAAQLIQRTNQFNLTSRRHSKEVLQQISEDSDTYWTRWFSLQDRFGDNGIIGLIIAKIGGSQWTIDTFLMSCRVIGRSVDSFMLNTLVEAARSSNATQINGLYSPTPKNQLVAEFYPSHQFVKGDSVGGETSFQLDIEQYMPDATPIKVG